jgi:hypothetical protein
MPLSICHITSMHDWHDDRIFQRTCKGLVREGVNVTCITTYPEDKTVEGVPVLGLERKIRNQKAHLSPLGKLINAH